MTITETAFDQYTLEYDNWFDKHASQYHSEILALKKAIPKNKIGIEIGVGTGRFAQPLKIKFGIEPSENMARVAEQRGIKVFKAVAEKLPIENESCDFVLLATTVCFLHDIPKAFSEVHRILKLKGEIIIGLIAKNSTLGKIYMIKKISNVFYKEAHFHSTKEITSLLKKTGFTQFQYWQTLTNETKENAPCACCTPDNWQESTNNNNEIEQPQVGSDKGGFVVIKAIKN